MVPAAGIPDKSSKSTVAPVVVAELSQAVWSLKSCVIPPPEV